MAHLILTNLLSYKTYCAEIASKNKAIRGFKWGDKDVIINDSRSDLSDNFLWAVPYEGTKYSGSGTDNILKSKQALLCFMKVRESELFEDEDADFQYCESIIEQIVSKILKDKRGELKDGDWNLLVTSIESMSASPAEKLFGSVRYIGYELRIDFMDNANMAFDATKWD